MEIKTQQITELRLSTEDALDLKESLDVFFGLLEAKELNERKDYFLYATNLVSGKKESELNLIVDLLNTIESAEDIK